MQDTVHLIVFLIHITVVSHCTVNKDGVPISQSVAYLLYPLLGWLTDVRYCLHSSPSHLVSEYERENHVQRYVAISISSV